jgi:ribosomal protein S18 acetylase RimI-like enzyme
MMDVNNAPGISRLKFRHFQGESDYSQIASVLMASEAADQTQREVDASDIANAYQHLSNCDPYQDMIIAEDAGEMIGYSRGWWENETSSGRLYIHNGFLIPEWRRKCIGRTMLLWMTKRLGELATTHPAEISKVYQVNVTQFQKSTAIMLERSGYQPARYFYEMVRPSLDDILESPVPAGVEIRPVSPDQYPAIWKAVDEASQDEWGYKKPSEEDYQEWLTSPHFQPNLWQVAWDVTSNLVVGHVLTFIHHDENKQFNRKRGYTEGIGVNRSWRRRGLARALISRSLLAQKTAGMTESALVADSDNPSGTTRLYENCGFQIVKCDTIYRKPMLV